ncbi:phosphotransferase [Pseudooceanicola sp.]|uniref:phosphotransferase family protein n=1 Tax=Pseudooceanicola sp. TaxID=1914328 RepID=UPI0026387870|nr:phosphotransferase [Pseudooceanicola sp.]MDF1856300.1 phosphotransferase [Pseudooceanicola sp.]
MASEPNRARGQRPQAPPDDLRQVLERDGLVPCDQTWSWLHGGRSNASWRISATSGPAMVVKLYGQAGTNPLFPNDPQAEASALRHLQGSGIAPQYLASWASDQGRALIYAMVEGPCWSEAPDAVARLLTRLHRMPPPPGLRQVPDGSAEIARDGARILALCAAGPKRDHLAGLRPVGTALPASGRRAFLHGDPVPGNLIVTDRGPVLIDWQCPAQGDPVEDIALFLSPAMQIAYRGRPLSAEETARFLAAYADPDCTARYRALAPWYHWRMAAYCLWRGGAHDPMERAALKAELAALSDLTG